MKNAVAIPMRVLVVSAMMAIIAALAVRGIVGPGTAPDSETLRAMEVFQTAKRVLWHARDAAVSTEERAELAVNDAAQTGLVGLEWSSLTTSPGYLDAKILSAHPLWVFVCRRWFARAGLQAGDSVVIATSGSFPAWLLAVRIAAESYGLQPIIIGSLTASNYGANVPTFDLMHMEDTLLRAGLVRVPISMITPGGDHDAAGNLEAEDRQRLLDRLRQISEERTTGTRVVLPTTLREGVEARVRHGLEGRGRIGLVVNVGGNSANHGEGAGALRIPKGLTLDARTMAAAWPESFVRAAALQGLPVLHLLDVRGVAEAEGIPGALPRPGTALEELRLRSSLTWRQAVAVWGAVLAVAGTLAWARGHRPGWAAWRRAGEEALRQSPVL